MLFMQNSKSRVIFACKNENINSYTTDYYKKV